MRANHAFPTALAAALSLVLVSASPRAQQTEAPAEVRDGKQIGIEYTLLLDDGSTAESNVWGAPLLFEAGKDEILPALEKELVGLKVNESKKVTVAPEDGYGRVDPAKFETVATTSIPEVARKPGAQLLAQDPDGKQLSVRVHEVQGDTIVLDLNHPLAGQNLHFEIKILSIE